MAASTRNRWIVTGLIGAVLLVGAVCLLSRSPSTLTVALLGAVVAFWIAAFARFFAGLENGWPTDVTTSWGKIAKAVGDIMPFVTLVALCIAAGFYFLERRDKFKYGFRVESGVVRTTSEEGAPDEVLVTVRISIENKGARQINFRCMSVDILHPPDRGGLQRGLQRNRRPGEEMQLDQLQPAIAYLTDYSGACMDWERRRAIHDNRPPPGRPLFIWRAFKLEPDGVEDHYFEAPVSCRYAFVRVLVKIRINPEDGNVSETKTIVPLADICRDRRDSSRGVSTPAVEGGPGQNGDGAATPGGQMAAGNSAS